MNAVFVARKGITIFGVRYDRGMPINLGQLPAGLRRRLVDQKRVVPRALNTSVDDPRVPADTSQANLTVGVSRHRDARQGTCGWNGGLMKNGAPCGRIVADRCQHHKI